MAKRVFIKSDIPGDFKMLVPGIGNFHFKPGVETEIFGNENSSPRQVAQSIINDYCGSLIPSQDPSKYNALTIIEK